MKSIGASSMLDRAISSLRKTYEGRVFAFTVVTNQQQHPQFAPAVAILGEPGYTCLSTKLYGAHDDYKVMAALVDGANAKLGYTSDTALAIVADTMHRSNWKADQEAGITSVKMSKEELIALKEVLDAADNYGSLGILKRYHERIDDAIEIYAL